MRVLICGDRKWKDYAFIVAWVQRLKDNHEEVHHVLKDYPSGFDPLVIIEGEAPGADRMSRIAGEALGIQVLRFPADWKKYGKAAGPIRNQQMLDEGKPDLVMAFHDNIASSKGTQDMIEKAKKARLPWRVYSHTDPGLPRPESGISPTPKPETS